MRFELVIFVILVPLAVMVLWAMCRLVRNIRRHHKLVEPEARGFAVDFDPSEHQ